MMYDKLPVGAEMETEKLLLQAARGNGHAARYEICRCGGVFTTGAGPSVMDGTRRRKDARKGAALSEFAVNNQACVVA